MPSNSQAEIENGVAYKKNVCNVCKRFLMILKIFGQVGLFGQTFTRGIYTHHGNINAENLWSFFIRDFHTAYFSRATIRMGQMNVM